MRRTGSRVLDVGYVGVVAGVGYLAGLVAGFVATATIESGDGRAIAGVMVQLVASLSSVVAVAFIAHASPRTLRFAAAVTAIAGTALYVVFLAAFGHLFGALASHAVAVVSLVTFLLHHEVGDLRDRSHRLAENH